MKRLALTLFLILTTTPAFARPVSYADGAMLMTMNDAFSNSIQYLYSPSAKLAIGPVVEYWRDTEATFAGVQFNALLKRWNNPDSQANLYLLSNVGGARDDDSGALSFSAGIEADWENRRFFTSYENRYTSAGGIMTEYTQKARVGVAPYIGSFGDLHTWLMLQIDHRPEDEDNFTATPLIRLFKDNWLAEGGANLDGGVLFNMTLTF